jgi:hypothetical protein
VAVNVVMADVPPIFRMALAAWVKLPDPESAVLTVKVLLLVTVIPVTVTFAIVNRPLSCCALVSKVCTPVPALKAPLLVMPPLKVTGELAEVLVQAPPALMVTGPVNILVPVAEVMFSAPLAPPPTLVVPVTVKANPAALNVVPSPIFKLPPIVKPATVVVVAVPLKVRFPVIEVVPVCNVLAPALERVRLP